MADKVENLLRQYRGGVISRREFLHRAAILAGGTVLAATLVESLPLEPAGAVVVEPDDPSLLSSEVEFAGDGGVIRGYWSRPKKKTAKRAGLIIVHQGAGLTPFIRDVTRRAAKEGYVALAPDLLPATGGTGRFPEPGETGPTGRRLSGAGVMEKLQEAFRQVRALEGVAADKVGVMGFGRGGTDCLRFSARYSEAAATVVFYGGNPVPVDVVRGLSGPFLGIYGELDREITSQVPALEQALKKYHKVYEIRIYPGARHAFLDDTNPALYDPQAAGNAWIEAAVFLKKYLKV